MSCLAQHLCSALQLEPGIAQYLNVTVSLQLSNLLTDETICRNELHMNYQSLDMYSPVQELHLSQIWCTRNKK